MELTSGCVDTNIVGGSSIKPRDARNDVNSAEEHLEGESVLLDFELEAPADQSAVFGPNAFSIISTGAVGFHPCFPVMQLPLELMMFHHLSGKGGAIDVERQRRQRGKEAVQRGFEIWSDHKCIYLGGSGTCHNYGEDVDRPCTPNERVYDSQKWLGEAWRFG